MGKVIILNIRSEKKMISRPVVQFFGIDTIRIFITDSPQRIAAFLKECTELKEGMFSHPDLPYTEVFSNPYRTSSLSLQFCVPKVARDSEDNTRLASPHEVAIALRKIQERTGFNTFDATLPRIDITLCFKSNEIPLAYSDLFRESKYFCPEYEKDGSVLIKRSGYEIILYDKGKEMTPKGEYLYKGCDMTRIELRVPERASKVICNGAKWKHGENGEFYARSLTTDMGFLACLIYFQRTVEKNLRLSKFIQHSKERFRSPRSLSLYKYLAASDKECEKALAKLCYENRLKDETARLVLNDLRDFRRMEKLALHATEIKNVIDSQIY